MATIAEVTKRINANTAEKDDAVTAYRAKQKILTAELDALVAAEAAIALVADMSDTQRQAILTELGGN